MFAAGAAVDLRYPAENGDRVLVGHGIDGVPSLSECGVKIAIAF